jgi:hypothetical protein
MFSGLLAATLVFLVACSTCDSAQPTEGRAGAALGGELEVPRRICAGPCGGPIARVAAWKNASDKVVLYIYDGDFNSCSHPPRLFYDGEGKEVGAVGSGPVPAGQEAPGPALAMSLTAGLTEAWTRSCDAITR